MKSTHVFWQSVIQVIKMDAEEMGYTVDILKSVAADQDIEYIYYHDDDQTAIYKINEAGRDSIMEVLRQIPEPQENPRKASADCFWANLNEYHRITI